MEKDKVLKIVRTLGVKSVGITLALCLVYSAGISKIKSVKEADLRIFDTLYAFAEKLKGPDRRVDNVVLIAIDDESIRNMEIRWPWPRSYVAEAIRKISEFDPVSISIDLIFTGKSDDPNQDIQLANALKGTDNAIAAAYFGGDGRYVMPDESIADNVNAFGFVNKPRDIDNAVRRMRPFVMSTNGNIIDYSLSVKTAAEVKDVSSEQMVADIPLMDDDTAYIHYFGGAESFPVIPIWKVLKDEVDLRQVRDKMVFIGVEAEVFHDSYQTTVGHMPGVLIAANETLTYITKDFLHSAGFKLNFAILFFFVLLAVITGLRLSVIHGIVINLVAITVFLSAGLALLVKSMVLDYFGVIFLMITPSVILYGNRYVSLALENMMLKKESITDGLTRLYGYKYFELKLKSSLKKALQEGKMFALEMYDIDHFKNVNDTYGHEFGNVVLKAVAKVLSSNSRKNDTVARFGGEEFCVLIPETKKDIVNMHAERVRTKVKEMEFTTKKGEQVKITISGGVVNTEEYISEEHLDILRAADSALYKSKETGRDKISFFQKGDELAEENK
ncbi:MAG: diguanylate cyclase [Candidatus Aadella gelida]|nr:diguanylate cyclase [Candidatus Aadella gelida]